MRKNGYILAWQNSHDIVYRKSTISLATVYLYLYSQAKHLSLFSLVCVLHVHIFDLEFSCHYPYLLPCVCVFLCFFCMCIIARQIANAYRWKKNFFNINWFQRITSSVLLSPRRPLLLLEEHFSGLYSHFFALIWCSCANENPSARNLSVE